MAELETNNSVSSDQLALAKRLGVDISDDQNDEMIIRGIEGALGQNTLLEQSRYFVLSVLNHVNKLRWDSISNTKLSEERQLELARLFIDSDDLKQSLRTVLKDSRFKFTLLRFAKTRNIDKRVLSTTTKAFKEARALLVNRALIEAPKKKTTTTKSPKKQEDSGSLVDRRAARRGYFDDDFLEFLNPQATGNGGPMDEVMSDDEFNELDVKISAMDALTAESWSTQQNEDRMSLLVGLAAGCAVFAVVIWMAI